MRTRRLGRTGLTVSEATLGTARLTASDRGEASAMLSLALERGVNAIELDAGDTEAARLVGEVLKNENAAHRVHIFARATSPLRLDLPSPHLPAGQIYPGAGLRADTERLLASLGVERLASLQLHAFSAEWLGEGDWLETLQTLRTGGKIAAIGVSLFDHDVESGFAPVAGGAIDTLQMLFNPLDPAPAASGLLASCRQHDIGVIARAPLYYGALAGKTRGFAADDWRAAYFHEAHARETEARIAAIGGDTAALALRFAISHPAVSTVAFGMRTREQLVANLAALEAGPLAPEQLVALKPHAWLC